jgi:hypothetical protein
MSTASITSTSLGKSFKFVAVLCSVVVFFSLSALAVHAAPLAPGASIPAPAEPDPTGGVPVAGGLPVAFASANYTGTLTSTVIAGDPSNPLGGLTFTYLLTNDASSLNSLERMTISSFAGFATDVSYQFPAAGVPPTFIDRNPLPGDVVGFSFFSAPIGSGAILPGTNSALLVIQTDAPTFQPSFAHILDGTPALVASYAPAFGIPEPSTLVLAIVGGLALLIYRRRRA